MTSYLLDTHVWIWYVNGNEEINKIIKKKINTALHENTAYLAAISLWEIGMLAKKKRIILEMPCLSWINKSIEDTHVRVLPITPAIATESCYLPGDFHDDPADRLIAATARVENCIVLTRDARLIAYAQQKYISVIKV